MATEQHMRTLNQDESEQVWKQLQEHWDTTRAGWYPMTGREMPPDVIAFQAEWFFSQISIEALHRILQTHAITRIWELREGGAVYEMDYQFLEPFYDGEEGYWTSQNMDWLIYVSHEHSLTVAGEWLIAAIKTIWPRWKEHLYTTYDFEPPSV